MADRYVPSPLKSVMLRPLTGGIVRNRASHQLKPSEQYDLKNYFVTPEGLYRRPGTDVFYDEHESDGVTGQDLDVTPIGFATLWKQTGNLRDSVILTPECALLGGASSAVSRMVWLYETGTATLDTTLLDVTGSGTTWASDVVRSGDFFRLSTSGGEYYTQWIEITGVSGNTSITLSETPMFYNGDPWDGNATVAPSSDWEYPFELARNFSQTKPYLLDYVVTSDPNVGYNELIVASPERPLAVYNETQERFDDYITDDSDTYDASGGTFFAACVTSFMERLWVGHTVEYDSNGVLTDEGDMRHRLRWSSVTDKRDFSDNYYVDLPYMNGDIIKLVPLGNTLVVYANDAIFIGTPTSRTDLPLSFQQVDMGGQGLVGQKAIVPWLNGHFFVGQDDVYFLSMQGPQAIGSPIVRQTIRKAGNDIWRTYATVDPINKQIMFGFPEGGGQTYIGDVWAFNYETKAWSRHQFPGGTHAMIANPVADDLGVAWDDSDVAAVTWDTFSTLSSTWDGFKSAQEIRSTYIENNGSILRLSASGQQDSSGSISTLIETGDFDGGAPDDSKIFTRLSVKTEDIGGFRSSALSLAVQGSVTGGRSWKNLGTVTIPSDKDEGYVNFRLSGSMVRFKLSSTSVVDPYVVTGLGLRVRMSGSEFALGTTDV